MTQGHKGFGGHMPKVIVIGNLEHLSDSNGDYAAVFAQIH